MDQSLKAENIGACACQIAEQGLEKLVRFNSAVCISGRTCKLLHPSIRLNAKAAFFIGDVDIKLGKCWAGIV